MAELADDLAAAARPGPRIKMRDSGDRISLEPEGMAVPGYGKGMSWGVTAYRGQLRGQGVEPRIYVRDARLPEEARGTGAGVAMYEKLAQMADAEGLRFQSDGTVTNDGVHMWAALKRRGHNVQTASNHLYRPGPPEAPHLGTYQTPDGSPMFWVDPKGKVP